MKSGVLILKVLLKYKTTGTHPAPRPLQTWDPSCTQLLSEGMFHQL